MIDNLEHGPFLGAEEFPGPRGKNEGIPSGDRQRAHEKVLMRRKMGRELEGVGKEACVGSAVSSRTEKREIRWGRTDDVGHGWEGGRTAEGEGGRRLVSMKNELGVACYLMKECDGVTSPDVTPPAPS